MSKRIKYLISFIVLISLGISLAMNISAEELDYVPAVTIQDENPVYGEKNIDGTVLETLKKGTIIQVSQEDENWYKLQVTDKEAGSNQFIHTNNIELAIVDSNEEQGLSINDINVYDKPSSKGAFLNEIATGNLLTYKKFVTGWVQVEVEVNDQLTKGYVESDLINKIVNEVESAVTTDQTIVYNNPSEGSQKIDTFSKGKLLNYLVLDNGWYATSINGTYGFFKGSTIQESESNPVQKSGIALKQPTKVYSQPNTNSDAVKDYASGSKLVYRTFIDGWYEATVYVGGIKYTGYIDARDVIEPTTEVEKLQGVALKDQVNVYKGPSHGSGVHKSYQKGSILKYETFSDEWYKAYVYVGGKKKVGYIAKSDVVEPTESPKQYSGIATKEPTLVYHQATKNSKALKAYSAGSKLIYNSYIDGWYQASVYINGQKQTGYISSKDVQGLPSKVEKLSGVAVNSKVHVYQGPTKDASVHKSYLKGSILKYETFSDGWYRAFVYVNGKRKTGYIAKTDVIEPTTNPKTLNGIAIKHPTKVYAKANKNVKQLKSYRAGSNLKYETFIDGWYKATIYLNGKKRTGYIHANDVYQPTDSKKLEGVAVKAPVHVYEGPTRASKARKSYSKGSILKYRTFMEGWYQATIYKNGKKETGYIASSDVEQPTDNPKSLEGISLNQKTHVYSTPSKNSKPLKSYHAGSLLKYETYINNWYRATVYVNGKKRTGYIYSADVETPKADGKITSGIAKRYHTKVYSGPNNNTKTLKNYREGSVLKFKPYLNDWYKATVYINGKANTGYINKKDILLDGAKQTTQKGFAAKPNVYVYNGLSKKSTKLKGYSLNSQLTFKTYTDNWYEATVYVNGKPKTGYISKSDIIDNQIKPRSFVNPKQVYSYRDMVTDINQLEQHYSGLINTEVIGKSVEGRNIYLVKLGYGDTKITINAAHHAREWLTTNLVMNQIDQYSQAFAKGSKYNGYNVRDLLSKVTIYYVPMVNPDGVTLNQFGPSGFSNYSQLIRMNSGSKDFKAWKANSRGVDLNRQYPAGWNTIRNLEYSPGPERFKGLRPLSEPEVIAVANLAKKHNFKTHVAYHSSGEVLYWAYNAAGSLRLTSRKIANQISNQTGYWMIPQQSNPSGGGYTDWVIDSLKTPGFTPEISPHVGPRPVPISNFDRIWNQNKSIGLMLAEEAYNNRNKR
ncbi:MULTISPECIES: M14 family metallocarboxypeptidase [Allobacillus]|uniref:Peptidase M14 domain-containing protein n=1 Tax=Allobacillus salarius TaxID=1955272 RepID=A0A556PMM5_9BACI|nr:M14 family metallocarboxypeptidase [Allobacillus salarius]TSJ65655.1 hypothetical protein FPQ13_06280 [Allobacillus salarius]